MPPISTARRLAPVRLLAAAFCLAACDGTSAVEPRPDATPDVRRDPVPPPSGGPGGLVPLPFPIDTVFCVTMSCLL